MDEQNKIPKINTVPTNLVKKEDFLHRHLFAELISVLLVAATLAIIYYIFSTIPVGYSNQPIHHIKSDSASDWKTYTSTKDGYQLNYPGDWQVKIDNDLEGGEFFSVYNSNNSEVSVYPRGVGTEGESGPRKDVTEDVTLAEGEKASEVSTQFDGPFYYQVKFVNKPASWSQYGFVEGLAHIDNVEYKAGPSGEPFDILVYGNVNKTDLTIIKQILSTFKFTK